MQIFIKNLGKNKLPLKKEIIKKGLLYLFGLLKIKRAQINIYFVNTQKMRYLNRLYLKEDCSTDVLTFDLGKNKKEDLLAEIIICPAVVKKNAQIYGNSFAYEIMLCIIHGLLHILGFDDKDKKNKNIMFKKQDILLEKLSSYIYRRYKIRIN